MNTDDYVSITMAPEIGIGQVISNDGQYIAVYFESCDEEMEFAVNDHPLQKENNSANVKAEHISNVNIQKKIFHQNPTN